MRHVADGVLQRLLVGFAHPFRDAQGERALAELFHQDVLPLDRDDGDTVLDNPPCESVHNSSSFSEIHNF